MNNKYRLLQKFIYKYNNFFMKTLSFELYKKIIYEKN